jgi:plasmid stabilization system protein ParE
VGITDYIAQDSERRARIVGRKLLESTRRLARFPFSGRMIPEYRNPDFREIIVYSYRVMYRVTPGQVTVVNVFHSRRGIN